MKNTRTVLIPTPHKPNNFFYHTYRIKQDSGGLLTSPCSKHSPTEWCVVWSIEHPYDRNKPKHYYHLCPKCETIAQQECHNPSSDKELAKDTHSKLYPEQSSQLSISDFEEQESEITFTPMERIIVREHIIDVLNKRKDKLKSVLEVYDQTNTFTLDDTDCIHIGKDKFMYSEIKNYLQEKKKTNEPEPTDDMPDDIYKNLSDIFGEV